MPARRPRTTSPSLAAGGMRCLHIEGLRRGSARLLLAASNVVAVGGIRHCQLGVKVPFPGHSNLAPLIPGVSDAELLVRIQYIFRSQGSPPLTKSSRWKLHAINKWCGRFCTQCCCACCSRPRLPLATMPRQKIAPDATGKSPKPIAKPESPVLSTNPRDPTPSRITTTGTSSSTPFPKPTTRCLFATAPTSPMADRLRRRRDQC